MRFLLVLLIGLMPFAASAADLKTALFAGGNFWAMQYAFDAAPGVDHTIAGYTGGILANPSYLQVARGDTGHRFAVMVFYDPAQISYERLLQVYWHNIDPVDKTGQFCDRGPPFTSAIYYADARQKAAAEDSKALVEADSARLGDLPVATVIAPAGPFYPAESYHQAYYRKNPLRFRFYTNRCGRDQRLYNIWGDVKP
jgi:peptide-methionine (S)-S-oxide reductase